MRDNIEDYKRRVRLSKEGRSALQEDEREARATIKRLGDRFLAGKATAAQERELRNALALVRRSEKLSREEMVLRARRGWAG